jgi:hypothetical protein
MKPTKEALALPAGPLSGITVALYHTKNGTTFHGTANCATLCKSNPARRPITSSALPSPALGAGIGCTLLTSSATRIDDQLSRLRPHVPDRITHITPYLAIP